MGQVHLAADRRDGRPGLRQPLRDPARVEQERRRQERHTRRRPADQHLPTPGEDHGRAERQDELGLHQGQAEREAGQVRSGPQRDRGADAEGHDPVELRVEHHHRGRDRREGGKDG